MICLETRCDVEPQVNLLTISENKMERRNGRKGMQGEVRNSMGKCWLRGATGLWRHLTVSQFRGDTNHTGWDADVLQSRLQKTWSFGVTTELRKCMNSKSCDQPACPWSFIFLAITRVHLVDSSILLVPVMHIHSPGVVPLCWFVLLLIFFRKVARLSCSPGSCQLLPSWKSKTELQLVLGGTVKPKKHAIFTAIFNISLLVEQESNLCSLQSLLQLGETERKTMGKGLLPVNATEWEVQVS